MIGLTIEPCSLAELGMFVRLAYASKNIEIIVEAGIVDRKFGGRDADDWPL